MAWDGGVGEMVLVTAASQGGSEAWIWSGARWVPHMTGYVPNAAFVTGVAFDPVTRMLLAVGCCQISSTGGLGGGTVDTAWLWNGSEWRQLILHPNPPAVGSSLALDPALGRLVLCSCDGVFASEPAIWVWSGKAWSLVDVAPAPVTPAIAIGDVDRHQLQILGSLALGSSPIHVWSFDGTRWQRLDRAR